MKNLSVILIFSMTLFGSVHSVKAQFLKDLRKRVEEAAKETIARKIEDKTIQQTENVMDTILNVDKKIKTKRKKKKGKSNTNQEESGDFYESESTDNPQPMGNVNSKKDFEAGSDVIFKDTFKNDAIGDFPVTWNTNSSAEVVTFDYDNTKWIQLDSGEYTPDGITEIPENCTLEFDLSVSKNFNYYSYGLTVNIIAVQDRKKDFMKWSRFKTGKNGVRLRIKPITAGTKSNRGETFLKTYLNGDKIIDKTKSNDIFTIDNNTVHVAFWRQKSRLRIYLNGQKIWDIPRAFGDANYNAVSFNTEVKEDEHFYISNLRLAIAGKDMRKALLEAGKFVTNDILFDVSKADIKSSSYKTLDELGEILQNNPEVSIKIIGHTDSDGSAAANKKLSEKRALAIKKYLHDTFDIANERMETIGKGESEPIAPNDTPKGKAKNRRVEFIKLN